MEVENAGGSPPPESEGEGEDLRPGQGEDSSEEGSDDPEAERAIREGFIVDDDDEEGTRQKLKKRRRKHKKEKQSRRRAAADAGSDEGGAGQDADDLDEDDLDLIGATSSKPGAGARKLRRLREGSVGSDDLDTNMEHMFDDEDQQRGPRRAQVGEEEEDDDEDDIDDFIDDDDGAQAGVAAEDGFDDDDDRRTSKAKRMQDKQARGKAKRKFRGLKGIDRDAWEEISELFGTGEEYAWAMELDPAEDHMNREASLKDIYEPAEIAARHLTQTDAEIRQVDLPERFQVLQRAYLPSITYDEDHPLLLPEDLDSAVTYIAPRISAEHTKTYFAPQPDGSVHPLQTKFVESVGAIINEMHITGSREVPYLSAHRRDLTWSFEPTQELLNRAALWRILHLTFEFRGLLERQKGLLKRFDRLNVDDEYWTSVLWERCSGSLEGTADLAEWLALIHGARARDVQAAELESNGAAEDGLKSRRPMSKQTKYARAQADGAVRTFASKFGLSPSQLVKAFMEIEPAPGEVEDAVNAPDAEAYELTQSSQTAFKDERTLTGAARHLLVSQLSADPLLRQHLRQLYEGLASVSVKPTERGQTVIDEGHPYATFKYLNSKPVSAFDGSAQFLHIATAESEGLLEVELTVATDARQQLFAALSELCASKSGGAVASAWNEEREGVLADALQSLEAHAVAHMKHRLNAEAQDAVLRSVSDSFAHRIECIPYSRDPDVNNPHRGDTPSVLALSAGAGEPRKDDIRAVFLDSQGRMRESTTLETLAAVGDRRPEEEQTRAADARDSFKSLVRTRQPAVIVVGGWTVRTRALLADVRRIVDEEVLETPVIMVEDTTARLYRHSAEAHAEFSTMHEVARYCVGLARCVQCPAASYAALSQAQLESVRFDANQKYVPIEKLRFELEQVLVSVVNYTGIDLNRAVRNPYYQKQLPYLAGLGPRKAHMLVDKLTSVGGTLLVRADLFSKSMLKQNVFWNCTAFIRIDQAFVKGAALELGADDEHPDILDATRIHNEDYEIARKMASDAEELDDEDISALEHPSDAVRQLLADDVKKLDDLRLDDFAEELSKIMGVPKRLTLYHIREELQRPFFDKRPPMPVLTPLQAFQQISGETSESLGTGMIVPAVVMRVDPSDRSLQVRLDSGVDGQIASGYVVDGGGGGGAGDVQEVADVNLKVGDTVRAAVLRGVDQPQPDIMDSRHKFELDCRPSSIENLIEEERSGARRRQPLDEYYDAELARQDISAAENKKSKKTGRQRRLIQHACFHNMNSGQAELHLTGFMRGDCVIRPSSMGVDHLTCTWKVAEGIYQHFDILELEKPEGNNSALGRKLQVNTTAGGPGRGRVVYSDLDELIHSHVRAMAAKVEEMINHEKFKGTEEDTLTFCRNYQMANPGKPIYAFAIDQDKRRAGHFRLMFIVSRGQEPQTWPVKVVPRGFILGDAEIGSVNDLCNAFKLQYGLRHQSARQGGQSTYAPGRTPKYGGGSVYGRTPMGGSRTPMGGRSAYQGSTAYGYR